MKLYNVKFDEDKWREATSNPLLSSVKFELTKKYSHPDRRYLSSDASEEEKAKDKELENYWENISIEDAAKLHPKGIKLERTNAVITSSQFESCFDICKIVNIIDAQIETQLDFIDLDALADRISLSLVSKTGSNLFNNKLNIHQPSSPLMTYNSFTVLTDCCTEHLQNEFINNGYRVVAVCPQPDQRRPDYIVGKYIPKDND